MVRGPLRSYISSTSKFDFHVEEDGEKVKEISDFLIKAGKARLSPLERKEGPSSSVSPFHICISLIVNF